MHKVFKYRIYPNKVQQALLQSTFGCCRFVYNKTLDIRKTAYETDKTKLSKFDLIKKIKPLKDEFPWLATFTRMVDPSCIWFPSCILLCIAACSGFVFCFLGSFFF